MENLKGLGHDHLGTRQGGLGKFGWVSGRTKQDLKWGFRRGGENPGKRGGGFFGWHHRGGRDYFVEGLMRQLPADCENDYRRDAFWMRKGRWRGKEKRRGVLQF